MDLGLQGKVALVTGASTGIGHATATALRDEGAIVVGVSRRLPESPAPGVDHRTADLSLPGASATVVEGVVADHGRIDVLVNNAAHGFLAAGFVDDDVVSWQETFALNLMAAVEAMRTALPHLEARSGAIVSVTSVNARWPAADAPAYSASKAALLNATKNVANEYVGRVRANVVSPGLTATPMWLGDTGIAAEIAARNGGSAAEVAAQAAQSTPLRRFLQPEEIAAAVCFLASPKASAITGAELSVDGGLLQTI
jgi:NAD(P)-dependent dehydrogenase (short-subunit alcohol dehydrogenase family)